MQSREMVDTEKLDKASNIAMTNVDEWYDNGIGKKEKLKAKDNAKKNNIEVIINLYKEKILSCKRVGKW